MDVDSFLRLAEALTGTPVKDATAQDRDCLAGILQDDKRVIRYSQFNELLLLVNKDRVSKSFFEYFFGDECPVGSLSSGVEKFQITAMLCFGNFIYAFRRLARIESDEELRKELAEHCEPSADCEARFHARTDKLLDIETIARSDTPLVGYLSAGEILAERGRARLLQESLPQPAQIGKMTWEQYEAEVLKKAGASEHGALTSLIARYRLRFPEHGLEAFSAELEKAVAQLAQREDRVTRVRAIATKNQDIYLTWDHMDVYFATSMRKRWEYEDLFDFIEQVMSSPALTGLNIRYFDPTQAYTSNRVNKGLVEALMLRRAKCTVYSVQDTDTLGKDSELAATLAQGKTVIAYVPEIDVEKRTAVLAAEDPSTIQERLRFVLYADDAFGSSLGSEDLQFVREFAALEEFERSRVWRTVPDDELVATFREEHGQSIERLAKIIAESEKRIYDRRARTLKSSHPLAIQVNLDTGVANGVLVVRKILDCAKLLQQVLTKSVEFDLVRDDKDQMWYLNERISGCPFRVVTKDRKLTNCFWNFYRAPAS